MVDGIYRKIQRLLELGMAERERIKNRHANVDPTKVIEHHEKRCTEIIQARNRKLIVNSHRLRLERQLPSNY